MKVKIKLAHKDGSELEFEIDGSDALYGAAIITRNGRYYIYQSVGGAAFNVVKFQEVDVPYQVDF